MIRVRCDTILVKWGKPVQKRVKKKRERSQIVAQIDVELAARMRAECDRLGQSQRIFIERAILAAVDKPKDQKE